MTNNKKHLHNLDELSDYKVADGYPNVKGWSVKDKDNRVIGEVENLLVNLEAQRVVYLDVEVDKTILDANYDPYSSSAHSEVREFINKDGENHVIIPIGLVDINEAQKFVYTQTVDHRTFAETKRYRQGSDINRNYEVAVLDSYNRHDDKNQLSEDQVRSIVRDEVKGLDTTNSKEKEYRNDNKVREIVRDEVHSIDSTKSRSEYIEDEIASLEERKNSRLSDDRKRLHRDDFDRKDSDHKDHKGLDFDHDNDGNPNITDPDYYKEKGRKLKNTDFDHDNDGNPNITDPDYYTRDKSKGRRTDFDHDNDGNPNISDRDNYDRDKSNSRRNDFDDDNDGNPNITDRDYFDKDRSKNKGIDFDNDNDGNPNITDPDYYEEKLKGSKHYDSDNDGIPDDMDSDTYDNDLERRRRNNDIDDDDDFYDRREFRNQRFRKD
ncbi:PRC-barrel domain-containing protein [Flavobacteriaceae bacterium MAR_2010_188]|nr:PRC-barrel domain-containing protein [Flavobacteriaceae bacterium MAR_2010_188]